MMRKRILLAFFLLIPFFTFSQKRNNIWCFGDSAGIDFNNLSSPQPILSNVHGRGSCVSIADTSGSLIFYANTGNKSFIPWHLNQTEVWNNNNLIVQNSDSINGESWYNELLIIPHPGNQNLYYLFTNSVVGGLGLNYSIIDMSLNGGLGSTIQKNTMLLPSPEMNDMMTGIKHGNGRDWWLINHREYVSDKFYSHLVTPSGVSVTTIQTVGSMYYSDLGAIRFSPDGTKLFGVNYYGLVEMYDFDRCTGVIHNPVTIDTADLNNPRRTTGISISPGSSKLYISNTDNLADSLRLWQYDLTATNIMASKTLIYIDKVPASGGMHALGPDGKIYISCLYTFGFPYADSVYNMYNMNLSVINYPDSLGTACDFQPFSFYLGGKRTYWGLPNNPDYDMGAWIGSPCDTLQVGINETGLQKHEALVYPNPSSGIVHLVFSNENSTKVNVVVSDLFGRIVQTLFGNSGHVEIDGSAMQSGIYFYRIISEEGAIGYEGKFAIAGKKE
jgi:hypothetical protein